MSVQVGSLDLTDTDGTTDTLAIVPRRCAGEFSFVARVCALWLNRVGQMIMWLAGCVRDCAQPLFHPLGFKQLQAPADSPFCAVIQYAALFET
jgi:hypothetical protein